MAVSVARHLTRIALTPVRPQLVAFQRRHFGISPVICDRFYTDKHEWVSIENGTGKVGISDYAQEQLGEIVYVELPEVGADLEAHDVAGCVESVKAASEIYTPVAGNVTEVNTTLVDNPQLVNSSPMEKGWLFKLKLGEKVSTADLMDESAYKKFVGTLE